MKNPLMKKSIIIAIVSLIAFGLMATAYTNYLSQNLYSETNEYLKEIAEQTALAINNRINENITQLDTVSLMIKNGYGSNEKLINYLNDLAQTDEIKRFGIADINGDTITSDHQNFNISHRDYFQKSLTGEKIKSNTLTDIVDDQLINVYSVPLYNQDNQITGVLFATFYTDKFANILNNANYNDTGYSFIFIEQGKIIIPSKQATSLANIQNITELSSHQSIELDQIDVHGSGIISFTDFNNKINYLTYANIYNNDWLVASVFPQEIVTLKIQKFLHTAFITWFIIGIGSASLISYIYFIQKRNKLQITKLAFEDSTTHHYNFNQFIEYCKKNNNLERYFLINCDIKGFKWFNEIYGRDIANQLLTQIVHSMDYICAGDELCCREADDHFAMLLKKDDFLKLQERLFLLANMIRNEFYRKYSTSQFYFHFGVYDIKEDNVDIMEAFRKTQYVKNDKKELSQDDVIFYQEENFQKQLHAQQIEKGFQSSLEDENFKVYIQPKVNLKTGKVYCGEALVRWHHPTNGIIPPIHFIPIFEKNGMLEQLDSFVFKKTLETLERWKNELNTKIYISVNVSRTYLFNDGFVHQFISLVEYYDIDPDQIEIEITETTALNHKKELIQILNTFKEHKIRIALDDFGSGYSSLNMLKDFPIDVVKIDQEFFRTNSYTHERSHIILEEIIELCHKLNLEIVAEGVETQEQKDFLVEHNCDFIQGYYYYKPMMIEDFEKLFIKRQ